MASGFKGLASAAFLLVIGLAGCLSGDENLTPGVTLSPVALPLAEPRFNLTDCQGSLSIWLVPTDLLAADLPPEFPPQSYQPPAADTPADVGRVLFHIFTCAANDRADLAEDQSLAVLSIRVNPPEPVAPEGDGWQTAYLLGAWHSTAEMAQLLSNHSAWAAGDDRSSYASIAVAPRLVVRWSVNGSDILHIEQEPVPPPEAFNPRMRFYRIDEDVLRIQDFRLMTTLWEGAGRPMFDAGSPLARYVEASVGPPDLHGLPAVAVDAEFSSVGWPLA